MKKKQENPVGYRPKGEIKAFLDEVGYADSPISKAQVIEIAMRLLLKDSRQVEALRDLASESKEAALKKRI